MSNVTDTDVKNFEAAVEAAKCPHCYGAGTLWTEELKLERERIAQANVDRVKEAQQELTQEDKIALAGSAAAFDAKVYAEALNTNRELWAAVKKTIGRAFTATLTENGGILLTVTQQLPEGDYFLMDDVALLLNQDRDTIGRWCQTRFREQERAAGREPIPFTKHGKDNVFSRKAVEEWWMVKHGTTSVEIAIDLASRKGRRKKTKVKR